MKKRILSLMVLTSMVTLSSYGQIKKITEDVNLSTELFDDLGTMSYSYSVADDGSRIRTGALTIKNDGKQQIFNGTRQNFTYRLNGTYKNNLLNGAISSTSNLYAYQMAMGRRIREVKQNRTLTGNMKMGVPNGFWSVKTPYNQLTANFNQGKLVGKFYCYVPSEIASYNGAFNAKGQMTGAWKIQSGAYKGTQTFLNGVLLSDSSDGKDTPPVITNLARKYALGQITEEELNNQYTFVKSQTINLYELMETVIFSNTIAPWSKIEGWDYDFDQTVEYKYLEKAVMLTESGFEYLLQKELGLIESDLYIHWNKQEGKCMSFTLHNSIIKENPTYFNGVISEPYNSEIYLTPEQTKTLIEKKKENEERIVREEKERKEAETAQAIAELENELKDYMNRLFNKLMVLSEKPKSMKMWGPSVVIAVDYQKDNEIYLPFLKNDEDNVSNSLKPICPLMGFEFKECKDIDTNEPKLIYEISKYINKKTTERYRITVYWRADSQYIHLDAEKSFAPSNLEKLTTVEQ